MRAVFMGTPDFALPTLREMLASGIDVAAVVTQPDKKKGRGRKLFFSPVKDFAMEKGIPVLQPEKIRNNPQFLAQMQELAPDVIVVAAFGQIIPREILELPEYGCVNVHGSLLPELRGAAPVQWAIISGKRLTGVTTMQMDTGLDTGDMLLKREVPIEDGDTAGTLSYKLSEAGAALLTETLKGLEEGSIVPEKQDDSRAGMYASMIKKEQGEIDFSGDATSIARLIRAFDPWPGCYTCFEGKQLHIWEASPIGKGKVSTAKEGTVTAADKVSFTIQTGEGSLRVTQVQQEGKKRMDAGSFLRGSRLSVGSRLGC